MADELIPMRDAVKLSGYHDVHIRKLIHAGRIKARKFGETWQISRQSLDAYLREQNKRGERRGRKPSR
jgi:excisionase family DNA binding protein